MPSGFGFCDPPHPRNTGTYLSPARPAVYSDHIIIIPLSKESLWSERLFDGVLHSVYRAAPYCYMNGGPVEDLWNRVFCHTITTET